MAIGQSALSIIKYQAGSYIIVENQPNSAKHQGAFFIIQSGKISLATIVDQMLGLQEQVLGAGSFFGVVSAISAQESNETAIALSNCSLIVVRRSKIGDLVHEAPSIALKIIRSLSNDLRHYNDELVRRVKKVGQAADDLANLFAVGEFFYKAKHFEHAAKVFTSYLDDHSDPPEKAKAAQYLQEMQVTVTQPNGFSRSYRDGDMICSEHMPGSELYIIQSGRVKITKIVNDQEMILAILDAGEIVGEMSLLNNQTRTANIFAYGGEAKIMAVNKSNFERIILQNKELASKLMTVLGDRLWTIYKQLANLLIEDPLTRLLDTLLTQLLRQHVKCDSRGKYQFSFGKTELLHMCGLSPEEGEEAFENLIKERYMSLTDEGIYCSDLEELAKSVEYGHKSEIRARKMRMAKQKNEEAQS